MNTRTSGRRDRDGDAEILRFGNLVFDPAGHGLRDAEGREIPLTPAEFLLLDVFVRSPGRALSREHLMNELGQTAESYDRSIDVLVLRLRRKIERNPKAPELIVTMPRVGYKFTARPQRERAPAGPPAADADLAGPPQQAPAAQAIASPTPVPDRPSIAVLPFQNMSGDPEQEYFADGIVEDIITALSRIRWLFVIARNSSFAYKGRAVDVKQVGAELGVRYVLEGSVRKVANRVRITGQLIDSSTGAHLWADKFDGPLDDIFDLQDQVATSVVGAIGPKLEAAEIARARRKPTENLDAYDCYLRGVAAAQPMTREATDEALRLQARASELDPDFAMPCGRAAFCYVIRKSHGWMVDQDRETEEAARWARRAAALGNDDAVSLSFAAYTLAYVVGDLDKAGELADRALAVNPNLANAWLASGIVRHYREGEEDVALEHLARAMRLSPLDPYMSIMHFTMGLAHFKAGRYDEAATCAERAVRQGLQDPATFRLAAAGHALMGRLERARDMIARVLELDPRLTLSNLRSRTGPQTPRHYARYIDALRKAGLPEGDAAPTATAAAGQTSRSPLPDLPDRPSIAVLSFENMSGDPEQDYFADGIAEDIITALSRMRWLFVIARNSSFTYKGRAVDVKQVGAELGVRYVLEGSVRKVANRVRITGQLIDASTGAHLWADRFDGELDDIFDLQDQVTSSVVGAIGPKLEEAEIARVKRKPTESLDAYDCYLRGVAAAQPMTREATDEALRLQARASELDPDFAMPCGRAAFCYVIRKTHGWMVDQARETEEAARWARRAAALGNDDAVALAFAAHALAYVVHDLDNAGDLADRALTANPNLAHAWLASGFVRVYREGEDDAAIEHLTRAMRLSPLDPFMPMMQFAMGFAHFKAGHDDEAATWAERAIRQGYRDPSTFRLAAASHALMGRLEQARKMMAHVLELDPQVTLSNLKDRIGPQTPGHFARYIDALRKAGMPEGDAGATAAPVPGSVVELAPMLQPAPAVATQRAIERRQVTVFSCEFSGLAALAARLDPEDLTELVETCRKCCADLVERFGGAVARSTGDGLTAHFGYPQADEHDAERAVRAALAAIEALAALATGGHPRIAARVGIATGPVVAGILGSDNDYSVVGETPTLAAVLRLRARPGTVLIAPGTRRLVGGLFEYRVLAPFEIDGASEPTAAFEVIGDRSAESRFLALRDADATSFVGRDDEIASLERSWRQAKSGEGGVVLISGEAGIGKSRLCAAFAQRIADDPHGALSFQCSPHHPDSVLHPVIAALDRAARFAREDTPEQKRARLDALLGSDGTGANWMLAHLIGIPAGPLPEMTPQLRKQRTLEAIIAWLARAAANGPLLLLFEDAHWVDPTSLDLLTLVVDRVQHLPILAMITARPEFVPPWPAEGHVKVVALNRLSQRDAAGLIQRVAAKPLPDQVVEEIVARTDRVPLFIEELTKAIIEGGHLADTGERYALAGAHPLNTIPATLQDSLNARLDRLDHGKEIAQVGAAIGREFSHAILAAALPDEAPALSPALDELVRSELVFRRGTPPDAVYTFKHALVRDAAYSSMPRARRKICHARIAAAILRDKPDIMAVQPELLAYHCQEAGDAERSIGYWLSAGRLANDRSANNEAVSHLSKGLELLRALPESRERDELELKLLSALAPALVATKGYGSPQTVAAYERTRVLMRASRDDSARSAILAGLYAVYVTLAEHEKALDVAEESLAAARRNDSAALCIANRLLTVSHDMGGRFELACQHGEQAWAQYDPEPHGQSAWRYAQDIGVAAGSFLSIALTHVGALDRATRLIGEVLALADRLGHHNTIGYAHCCGAAIPAFFMRDYGALQCHAQEMQTLGRERDLPQWVSWGVCLEAPALAAAGEIERAVAQMDAGLLLRERINNRHSTRLILTGAVEVHLRAGDASAALALTGKLLDEVSHERWSNADLWRLRADALLASGGRSAADEAEACYGRAMSIAMDQGSRLLHLRAATSLARLTAEAGQRGKARELLEPVLESLAEGFDKPDLRDAKALLVDLH